MNFYYEHLKAHGHEVTMFVKSKVSNDGGIVELNINRVRRLWIRLIYKIIDSLNLLSKKYNFHSGPFYFINSKFQLLSKIDPRPDVVILGWLGRFISAKAICEIYSESNTKFYWVMTDKAPMTGGCHYFWDCKGYITNCSNCPAVGFPMKSLIRKNMDQKLQFVTMRSVKPILPLVKELADELKLSSIFYGQKQFNFGMARNIDLNVFRPAKREMLRNKLGLKNEKIYFLFAVTHLKDIRKGYLYLEIILKAIDESPNLREKIGVIIIGGGEIRISTQLEMIKLDFVESKAILAEVLNAADYFLSFSRQDLGPTMLIYSMLCGTPAISFNTGIASQLIKNGISGITVGVNNFKIDIMAELDQLILYSPDRFNNMRIAAYDSAIKHCSYEDDDQRFQELIEEFKN